LGSSNFCLFIVLGFALIVVNLDNPAGEEDAGE
jgi:hypothetical protein